VFLRSPRIPNLTARRQVVLFVVAIVAPCALLVAMAFRMAAQDRELADKRRGDERLRQTDAIRRSLVAYLERTSLHALASSVDSAEPAAAVVARLDGDRLILPWDDERAAAEAVRAMAAGRFGAEIRDGEREELVENRPDRAVERYRRAVAAATLPIQHAYARLLLARALAKAGQLERARGEYLRLLESPSDVADEHGVPIWGYAAGRLAATGAAGAARDARSAVLTNIERRLTRADRVPPAERYLLRDLAATMAEDRSPAVRARASALLLLLRRLVADGEAAVALQRAFPLEGLRADERRATPGHTAPWVLYGDPSWFVSVFVSDNEARAIAIRAAEALARALDDRRSDRPRDVRLLAGSAREGDWLGDDFPGIKVAYVLADDGDQSRKRLIQRGFIWTILFLVLTVTASGGYFLWRDVRRELRLAAMRAQFVSSVSHELKTPLTAIRMFAETLHMGRAADPSTASEYLDTIVNECERLTRLLNNVLEFSKMERGTARFRLVRQPIGDALGAAVRAMSYPLTQQGFTLDVQIADALPPLLLDADAIEQAVLNLLTNAMKYSGGARAIELRVTREGSHVAVHVVDHGIGIPAHEQARIFDKFYRVASAENRHIPGTGLGLTLVDHIARAHGGTVRVTSAPGRGSTFSLLLPVPAADAVDRSAPAAVLSTRRAAS
jgi:signal transduction histidine kinase